MVMMFSFLNLRAEEPSSSEIISTIGLAVFT